MIDQSILAIGAEQLNALVPFIIVGGTIVVAMLGIAFRRIHWLTFLLTLLGMSGALVSTFICLESDTRISDIIHFDQFGQLWIQILLATSIFIGVLFFDWLKRQEEHPEEMYLLLLMSTLGAMILVVSNHFVSFFLGLELLSIPTYAMIAYSRKSIRAIEAAFKYLVLGGVSTAMVLFGIALLYAWSGTLQFDQISALMGERLAENTFFLLGGIVFLCSGIVFKLSAAPFHMWTPDVYEGAPAPVTAYLATVSKAAVFAWCLRFIWQIGSEASLNTAWFLEFLAIASMFVGNFLALYQRNIKRVLAYSSTANMGYLFVSFFANPTEGGVSAMTFLIAYMATILLAFAVLTILEIEGQKRTYLEDFRSFASHHPFLGGLFSVALLSLIGIPLTSGFIAKFSILALGAQSQHWYLLASVIASSGIGIYAYLRIIIAAFSKSNVTYVPPSDRPSSVFAHIVAFVSFVMVLGIGIWPQAILSLLR